jgi:hypothetical protein
MSFILSKLNTNKPLKPSSSASHLQKQSNSNLLPDISQSRLIKKRGSKARMQSGDELIANNVSSILRKDNECKQKIVAHSSYLNMTQQIPSDQYLTVPGKKSNRRSKIVVINPKKKRHLRVSTKNQGAVKRTIPMLSNVSNLLELNKEGINYIFNTPSKKSTKLAPIATTSNGKYTKTDSITCTLLLIFSSFVPRY